MFFGVSLRDQNYTKTGNKADFKVNQSVCGTWETKTDAYCGVKTVDSHRTISHCTPHPFLVCHINPNSNMYFCITPFIGLCSGLALLDINWERNDGALLKTHKHTFVHRRGFPDTLLQKRLHLRERVRWKEPKDLYSWGNLVSTRFQMAAAETTTGCGCFTSLPIMMSSVKISAAVRLMN